MATDLFANASPTTVTSGGTTAPAAGTVETWTVASSTGFPTVTTAAGTQFRVQDPAAATEIALVTNITGTSWTVTRGVEGTTPVAHTAGFTVNSVVTAGGLGALTTLTGTYAPLTGLAQTGRVWLFLGDSITAGTGSTNATTTAFVPMALKVTGGAVASKSASVNGGVAGNTVAQMLARLPALLAAVPTPQAVFLLGGTNDSAVTTMASFQATMQSIAILCRQAGVPLLVGTVPPRSAAQTTQNTAVRQFNMWLRLWAPAAGVRLVDVFAALVNPTTGALAAANDTGDGTHPSNAGHLAIGQVVAAAMVASTLPQPWPVSAVGGGLALHPLMDATTGWISLAGPQFASFSLVAASNGDVPYGQWIRMTLSNGASTGATQSGISFTTGFSVGDTMLLALYVRADLTASLTKVQINNQSGTALFIALQNPPSSTPGPIIFSFVVPASTTTLSISIVQTSAVSATSTVDVGACDLFNLTTMGLAATTI